MSETADTEGIEHIGNPAFLHYLDEMRKTHLAKAAGYAGQDNPDTWSNFREAEAWGLTPLEGCLVRMGDKYRRVQNLRRDPDNDRVGESIKATLMDLANYAIIAVCLIEEEEEAGAAARMREARKRPLPPPKSSVIDRHDAQPESMTTWGGPTND